MCNKKCEGFEEIYLEAGAELSVHICVTCGTVSDLYTYADEAKYLEYYKEKTDDFVSIAKDWKSEFNPLFVKCPPNKRIWVLRKLLTDEFNIASFCFDPEHEAEERTVVWRMLKRYNIEAQGMDGY